MRSGSRAGIGLELLILDPGQGPGTQAVPQHDLLDAQNSLEHRDVDARPVEAVVAPVHPPLRTQPPQQGRRELERLVAEDVVGQELEALALLGPGHRHDRVAGILVGLVVARDRLAADVLRGERGTVTELADQDPERAPGPGPRVAVLDHAGVQVLEQLGRQGDSILAELAGVRTQVKPVHIGIVVEERVLVGRVDQVVLGSRAAIFLSSAASSPSIGL